MTRVQERPAALRHLIDGEQITGHGRLVPVVNPADETECATFHEAGAETVDLAIAAARRALPAWKKTTEFHRRTFLHRLAARVRDDIGPLAALVTEEMGKPIGEAEGEAAKLADAFDYYAEEAVRVQGRTVPNEAADVTSIIRYEPVGVIGAVSPWNYPLELIGWKLAAALAAGCTLVLKPSEYAPSSAVRLFEHLAPAGIPDGVANLVLGTGETGAALTSHPGLDKVAFTGSTATGTAISRGLARPIPSSMELGGSCPMIVTASADIDAAVAGCLRRGFRNSGQICIAVNRVYVAGEIHADFTAKLARAVSALTVAAGTENPDVGPVTNAEIVQRCRAHVEDSRARGSLIAAGGEPLPGPGHWVQPTVVDDMKPDSLLGTEETFGPVVGVAPFTTLDEAVELANGTTAGLAAYVYARDVSEIFEIGHALDFGNVAVNNPDAGIMNAPYGGRKGSGHGYEHGPEGLHSYLQIKHLRIRHGR